MLVSECSISRTSHFWSRAVNTCHLCSCRLRRFLTHIWIDSKQRNRKANKKKTVLVELPAAAVAARRDQIRLALISIQQSRHCSPLRGEICIVTRARITSTQSISNIPPPRLIVSLVWKRVQRVPIAINTALHTTAIISIAYSII